MCRGRKELRSSNPLLSLHNGHGEISFYVQLSASLLLRISSFRLYFTSTGNTELFPPPEQAQLSLGGI